MRRFHLFLTLPLLLVALNGCEYITAVPAREVVFINNTDFVKEVMVKSHDGFIVRDSFVVGSRDWLNDNLATGDYPVYSRRVNTSDGWEKRGTLRVPDRDDAVEVDFGNGPRTFAAKINV